MQEILSCTRCYLLYRFEPEHAPNAEDSESENEELSDRLGGTFWCACERCETMLTQRECVCCREQPESENKMVAGILTLYCIGRSEWKNNVLCKLPSLDIKRRFNKAVSSYFFTSIVCIFILLLGGVTKGFHVLLQTKNFRCFV